jgi:hypothetical protein
MKLTEEQINWIVAEVIRRLGVAVRPSADGAAVERAANCGAVESPSKTDLKLTERLITLRTIEKQLSGMKRVVVQPKSVVTPAVKDELRALKIELVYQK